jgi:hypothetical protein
MEIERKLFIHPSNNSFDKLIEIFFLFQEQNNNRYRKCFSEQGTHDSAFMEHRVEMIKI